MTATIATFTDANAASIAGDFTATIAWGDGLTTTGTVTKTAGVYSVVGTHTYTSAGYYSAKVTIADVDLDAAIATTSIRAYRPVGHPRVGGGRGVGSTPHASAHQRHMRHLWHLKHG